MKRSVVFLACCLALSAAAVWAQQGGGNRQRPMALVGRVAGKTDAGFELQRPFPQGTPPVKVTINAETKLLHWKPATAEELAAGFLAEGNLVVVLTDPRNEKLARMVIRLPQPEGEQRPAEVREQLTAARSLNQWLNRLRRQGQAQQGQAEGQQGQGQQGEGQQGQAQQRARQPIYGRVVTAKPLTIQPIALPRRNQQAAAQTAEPARVELQTDEQTSFVQQVKLEPADLKDGLFVLVVPREPGQVTAATAATVVQLPPMRRRPQGQQGQQ